MSLTAGTRLGPYEIVSPLGAGGMGEVYRARDTKLGREVAVKVVADASAFDPERIARFEREAQLLASLNHPHIATVYGLEHSPSTSSRQAPTPCLVMELVEGETLAERLKAGALPLHEALTIAQQLADALQAAHEKGIIHRDLKPANIALTTSGQVKVLDFGLAKALEPAASGANISISPTLTLAATQAGVILGTAAYMAPEQAKGRPADKRSDIWAFGCVLYEMLTGRRAFEGEDVSDTMAAVLRSEPDWQRFGARVPPAIARLLHGCLQKDPTRRVSEMAVASFVIDETLFGRAEVRAAARAGVPRARVAALAAILLLAVGLTGVATWFLMRPAAPRVIRFEVAPPSSAPLTVGPGGLNVLVSADGSKILYHVRQGGTSRFELRRLEQGDSQPLPGTEGATQPAFSPDGGTIAFLKDGRIRKLALDAKSSVPVAEATNVAGISWGSPDTIVFAQSGSTGGLFRVAAAGGKPERLAAPDEKGGEQEYVDPDVIAEPDAVLFTIRSTVGGRTQMRVAIRSLKTGQQAILVEGASSPRYIPSGYLLYAQSSTLMAMPFDPATFQLGGAPITVLDGIVTKGSITSNYAIGRDGTLVYIPGSTVTYVSRFIWKDRTGRTLGVAAGDQLEFPRYPRISRDGRRLVVTVGPSNEGSVWVYDLGGSAQALKLTTSAHNVSPTWSPDGSRVAFNSTREGLARNIYVLPSDGSILEPERVVASDHDKSPSTWSPDGQSLLFNDNGGETKGDVWLLPMAGDRKPRPWLQTAFAEGEAAFSPDGRWVAYASDQTGDFEVWVRPFPGPGSPTRVSPAGGHDPVWARNGRELFYQQGQKLMAAEVTGSSGALQFKTPQLLFEGGFISWEPNTPRSYDVSPDGRFLMIEPTPTYSQRLNVVINWGQELKARVPVK